MGKKKGKGGKGGGGPSQAPPARQEVPAQERQGPPPEVVQGPPPGAGGGQQRGPPPGAIRGPPPGAVRGPPPGAVRGPSPQGQPQWRGPPPQGQQQWRGPPPQGQQQWRGPPPQGQQQWPGSPPGPPPQGQQQWPGPPPQGQQQWPGHPQSQSQQGYPQQSHEASPIPCPAQGYPLHQVPLPEKKQRSSPMETSSPSPPPSEETTRSTQSSRPSPPVLACSTGAAVELLSIPIRRQEVDRRSKLGKKIKIDVNHMSLALKNYKITAYHYDVVFDPEKPKFLLWPAINEFFKQNFPGRVPIFDGNKNLFSNGPLVPNDRGLIREVTVYNEESQRNKTITITICVVNKIDMSDLQRYQKRPDVNPQKALLVLDVALRSLSATRLVQNGRKFFSPPAGHIIHLGAGVELWHGHYQSAILGWKPFLCVDVSHKGFHTTLTVEEAIKQVIGADARTELDKRQKDDLQVHLKGLKVDYEIPGFANTKRTYRVNGVEGPPRSEKFKDDDNKQWTVDEYYRVQRKYRLVKPHLPCLWVGSRDKKVRVPGELCKISPGQSFNRKMDEHQTRSMVQAATSNTDQRRRDIMAAFRSTGLGPDNPFMKEFGISVAGEFERVEARILDPPMLDYDRQKVRPTKGMWRAAKFVTTKPLADWAILCLNPRTREEELRRLGCMLAQHARDVGMTISEPAVVQKIESRGPRLNQDLEGFFKKMKGKQMVFVVVPDRGDTYARVKTMAEITVGVLTQCIKGATISRLNPATIGNILLKVNAKLDGVNHHISPEVRPACLTRPVMIVGADVTHPAPGQTGVPSVAAVAASHDPKAFKYNMVWRLQPKGEMIVDLENIMKEQLMFFLKMTKYKPEKILFFRDGVSEGEIQKVMSMEVSAIRRACRALQKDDYEPKITFVVVQKRHHTRFFPADKRDCYDTKNFNLPAGTIVDNEIVHPLETEFLLLSHASILGTARPTKYRLVWDDSQFVEDELEKLTYYLCHLFTRCTRSVSYPAPTYYAHLAAFRARHYLEVNPVNINNLPEEQRLRKMNEQLMQNSPMFFV